MRCRTNDRTSDGAARRSSMSVSIGASASASSAITITIIAQLLHLARSLFRRSLSSAVDDRANAARAKERFHRAIVARASAAVGRAVPAVAVAIAGVGGIPHSHVAERNTERETRWRKSNPFCPRGRSTLRTCMVVRLDRWRGRTFCLPLLLPNFIRVYVVSLSNDETRTLGEKSASPVLRSWVGKRAKR